MTTDITELAQSLKAAAEKWQEAWGKYDKVEITIAEFIRAAEQYESIVKDPDNILALVEALEKAQTINAAAEKLVRCKGRYHSEQNYRALAALFGVNTPDLPPLDSESSAVTVKLPESFKLAKSSSGLTYYYADEVDAALTAAGIKVEAE